MSTEFVKVPASAREDGVEVDVTLGTVEMAFLLLDAAPDIGTDWVSAAWEDDDGRTLARCLVGPEGGHVLAVGQWLPWLRISGFAPEVPVLPATFPVEIF